MDGSSDSCRTARSAAELIGAGAAAPERGEEIAKVAARYAVAVTPAMLALIDAGDHNDPIGRQFVPDARELDARPEESADPIGDWTHSPVKGVVHRYPDRVLLKPTHACAVYCRFCFRREMVGPGGEALTPAELAAALDYVRANSEIWEVIVSGGDPLVLSPRRLGEIVGALGDIAHVQVIRIHTRVPVVEPVRIDHQLLAALASDKAVYVALHANHPREFTPEARAACRRIVAAGIPMLGQSVLLKGVNDDPATLEALMRVFVANRIKPYYLHHADLAPGTGHFRTTIGEGQALMRDLRGRASGLCQPTYVLDIPGGHGKVPIGPAYLRPDGAVEGPSGVAHRIDSAQ
ncbi:MAG TPA: lysine-2,3-aminomutase-like protein [Alphaproteobacteria bacterium]|nr:lysine-2,3-aminomutase-like protein [Alphaproteobacteria bacterium]